MQKRMKQFSTSEKKVFPHLIIVYQHETKQVTQVFEQANVEKLKLVWV